MLVSLILSAPTSHLPPGLMHVARFVLLALAFVVGAVFARTASVGTVDASSQVAEAPTSSAGPFQASELSEGFDE